MAQMSKGRGVGWILVLISLAVALSLIHQEETLRNSEGARVETTEIQNALAELETEVPQELEAGICREIPLHLPADHFIQVAVEQLGIDVVVRLHAPDGSRMVEVDSPIGKRGYERLSAVTAQTGDYVLAICSDETGQARLRVEGDRPATADDRRLVAALAVFADGEALRRKRERSPAIDKYRAALEVFRAVGDVQRQAEALHRIGWQAEELGQLATALDADAEAVALFRDLGERHRQGVLLNRIGSIHCLLGDSAEGLAAHRQALDLARELGDVDLEAGVLNNLGLAYQARYQLQSAIESFREALDHGRDRGTSVEATVWHNLGNLLMHQGQLEDAHDALQRALNLKLARRDPTLAGTRTRLGDVLGRLDRPDEAIGYLEQALEERRRQGAPPAIASTLNGLANVLLKAGRLEEAFTHSREAVAALRQAQPRARAIALMNLGRIHLHRGELDAAFERCDAARNLFESITEPWGEAASRHGQAQALHAGRSYAQALEHLDIAVDRVESLRAQVVSQRLRMSFFATKQSYYELLIDVLMHLAEAAENPEQAMAYAARAVQVSERRQARSLLEMLSETPDDRGGNPQLVAQEKELQRQLNGLAWARAEAASEVVASEVADERVRLLEKRQRAALLELDAVREQIRKQSSVYAELTQPRPLTLEEIRAQVVDAGTLLLIYSLGEERSFLWSISVDDMTYHVLPGRRRIERAATRVHRSLTLKHRAADRPELAAALSSMLLEPVAARLGRKRLAIVAGGRLLDIPFAALPVPAAGDPVDSGEERLLLADHEIVYLPSASVVATLRRQLKDRGIAPGWLAAVADPVFDAGDPRVGAHRRQPAERMGSEPDVMRSARALGLDRIDPLPASLDEVRSIAAIVGDESQVRLLVGFDARREAVVGDALAPFRILHFATHGLLNRGTPEFSGLILSLVDDSGEPLDGFLRAHEIYNLELSAELVVLSACETGLGKEVAGEGQISLTRGFMYAGVPRIMVSRWRVDDRGTAELMERFYFGMIEHRMTPPAALRCAQLSMQAEEVWSDPRYWAGFAIEGEWRSFGAMGDSFEEADTGAREEEDPGSDMPIPDGKDGRSRCEEMLRAWQARAAAQPTTE